jgi:NAD-dependent oxidoreductase involved in siderophore biosynthesis
MSFTREDYVRVCKIARTLSWEMRRRPRLQALAVELHDMAEGVIGQQMPPVARPRNALRARHSAWEQLLRKVGELARMRRTES